MDIFHPEELLCPQYWSGRLRLSDFSVPFELSMPFALFQAGGRPVDLLEELGNVVQNNKKGAAHLPHAAPSAFSRCEATGP